MVSIIIPVYNVERYLERCVSSALELTSECEIILVDDGSSDGSGALCDRLAEGDTRIKVIHQENGGLSAARNTGIRAAAGEYLMFVDSDDFLDPAETDKMLGELSGGTDVLLGLYRKYYEDGDVYENESCGGLLTVLGKTDIDTFVSCMPKDGRDCYMVSVRFIVRREFILENDLYFFTGIYHEDEEWTLRLLCAAGDVLVTHRYFYQYRQARAGSIMSSVKPKHIWDSFTIIEHGAELLGKQTPGSPKASYIRQRMAQIYLDNMINSCVLDAEEKKRARVLFERFHDICVPVICGKWGGLVKVLDRLLGTPLACSVISSANRVRKKLRKS